MCVGGGADMSVIARKSVHLCCVWDSQKREEEEDSSEIPGILEEKAPGLIRESLLSTFRYLPRFLGQCFVVQKECAKMALQKNAMQRENGTKTSSCHTRVTQRLIFALG